MRYKNITKGNLVKELHKLRNRMTKLKLAETEWKQMEDALRDSEERYKSLFNRTLYGVYIHDFQGNFIDANKTALEIVGYTKKDISSLNFSKLLTNDQVEKAIKINKEIVKHGTAKKTTEYKLKRKDGDFVWVETDAALLYRDGEPYAIQGIAKDITDRKRAEDEMKKKLMRFKLEEGKTYLIQETGQTVTYQTFIDLLKVGYTGVIITRTPINDFDISIKGNFEFIWLSEKGGQNALHPDLKVIENKVELLSKRNIVLIDRMDYLISKHGFNKVLSMVQRLRELSIISSLIIILSIDPSTVNNQQLRLLEKETNEVEPMFKPNFPESLMNILEFIYKQNMLSIKPSYTDIGSELKLCKPTIRKRIRQLNSEGYTIENTKGRCKVLEITEKGKNVFIK